MELVVSYGACLESRQFPSHSQSVGALCSHWVIHYSLGSMGDSGGISGPSDSGSRSTS